MMISFDAILMIGLFLISAGLVGCAMFRDRNAFAVSLFQCILGICLIISSGSMLTHRLESQMIACIITGLLGLILLVLRNLSNE